MRHLLFIGLFVMTFAITNAQNHYLPGYVVTKNKDTLRGMIDSQDWLNSPLKVNFRKNANTTPQSYTPNDLAAFSIESLGQMYVSKQFEIEQMPRAIERLNVYENMSSYANRTKETIIKTAFVKVLAAGKMNLYQFYDSNHGGVHFLVEKDNALSVLVYHVVKLSKNKAELLEYQNQLRPLLADGCNIQITNKISTTNYKTESLTQLIGAYNICFGKSAERPIKPLVKTRFDYGLSAGLTSSVLKFIEGGFLGKDLVFDRSNAPTFGGYFNVYVPNTNNHVSLMNDVQYFSLNANKVDNTTSSYNFVVSFIGLSNTVQYYVGNSGLFIQGGIRQSFLMGNQSTLLYSGRGTTTAEPYLRDARKYDFGWNVGVGGDFGNFGIDARYIKVKGFSPYLNISTPISTIQVLLKYRLSR